MPKFLKANTGGTNFKANKEMDKIITQSLKEAKQMGSTDETDIHMLVLKKENE